MKYCSYQAGPLSQAILPLAALFIATGPLNILSSDELPQFPQRRGVAPSATGNSKDPLPPVPSHSRSNEIDLALERYFSSLKAGPDSDLEQLKRHFPSRQVRQVEAPSSEDHPSLQPLGAEGGRASPDSNRSFFNKRPQLRRYRVAKGDTIWSLGKRYNASPNLLLRYNPRLRSRPLQSGEYIWVPRSETAHRNPRQSAKPIYHLVKRGDTLSSIGRRYGVTPRQIQKWNSLGSKALIHPRQRLQIMRSKRSTVAGGAYGKSFRWPLQGTITSGFGKRRNPFVPSRISQHNGIDIAVRMGTPFRSAQRGIVIAARWMGSYGNCILVRHPGGFVSVYAHNMQNWVKRGDIVSRGEVIGRVGRTGSATGPHLHFEMRKGKRPINPLQVLAAKSQQDNKKEIASNR